MSLKVVFCWPDISGYMAACWRALQQQPDIELFVNAFQARTETAFTDRLMQAIPHRLLNLAERDDAALIKKLVLGQQPDVLVLSGWFHPPYRQLASAAELRQLPKIMGMDTPWQGTLKQRLAPWLLRPYLNQIDHVVVTGERSWQYARHLRIPATRLSRGLYGVDNANLSPISQRRSRTVWPRTFLFAGRYATTKGIDLLVEAYRHYRSLTTHPWPLICCGQGPLGDLLNRQPGVENHGFVQPDQMATLWQQTGAFILPSRFDPWPLALVEAAATGLPVICTDACGSAVEVVRDGYNGRIIPSRNPEALTMAMLDLERRYTELPLWGQRGQQLAAPYAADQWGTRWRSLLIHLGPGQLQPCGATKDLPHPATQTTLVQ